VATDDSLAKLEEFNALLAKTLGELQEGTSDLENEGSSLDQAAGHAGETIGGLEEQLAEWLERLGSGGEEAGGQLRDLSEAASDGADDRLGAVDEKLEQEASTTGERVDAGQETLETGFADLRAQGFEALGTTLEELDGELAQDFAELASAVAATREQMVAAGAERVQELGEAQQEVEQHGSAVTEAADTLTSGVEAQQGAAEGDGEGIADGLDSAYDAWAQEAVSQVDEYVAALESAFTDAAEALGTAGEELGAAVDRAREESLGARDADLAESAGVIEAGEAVAGMLEPIVDDLEVVLRVVDQIQQLLSEMG
jgi:hypothetical protein